MSGNSDSKYTGKNGSESNNSDLDSAIEKQKKESAKVIRIQTIIPFAYPVSNRRVISRIDGNLVEAIFHVQSRKEILRLLALDIFPDIKWRRNDKFGQLNLMKVVFLIHLNEEKIIAEVDNDTAIQSYLEKCCSLINQISTGFRLAAKEYFSRNYTLRDIIGYQISFSKDGIDFFYVSTRTVNQDEDYILTSNYYFQNVKIELDYIVNDYAADLPLYDELILNADDFYQDSNFRMSIVEVDTAVEYIITKTIKKNLSGKYDPDVNNFIFNKFDRKQINQKKSHLDLVNPSITLSKEWNDWHKDCHQLRNDILHGKVDRPNKRQAEKAITAAKKLIELLKNYLFDWKDWLNEGIMLYSNAKILIKETTLAEKCFEKSLSMNDSSNPLAFMYLGDIQCDRKQYYKSICSYKKSIGSRKTPECYFHLGLFYEEMKLFKKAVNAYNESIKLNFQITTPGMNPYYNRFRIIERGKKINELDLKEIIVIFTYLKGIFPIEREFWLTLAFAYYYDKQYQNAIDCVSDAIDIFGLEGKSLFLFMRARFAAKLNSAEDALKDLQDSIKLDQTIFDLVVETDFEIIREREEFKQILNEKRIYVSKIR